MNLFFEYFLQLSEADLFHAPDIRANPPFFILFSRRCVLETASGIIPCLRIFGGYIISKCNFLYIKEAFP
jgi:hypothetical protein